MFYFVYQTERKQNMIRFSSYHLRFSSGFSYFKSIPHVKILSISETLLFKVIYLKQQLNNSALTVFFNKVNVNEIF